MELISSDLLTLWKNVELDADRVFTWSAIQERLVSDSFPNIIVITRPKGTGTQSR